MEMTPTAEANALKLAGRFEKYKLVPGTTCKIDTCTHLLGPKFSSHFSDRHQPLCTVEYRDGPLAGTFFEMIRSGEDHSFKCDYRGCETEFTSLSSVNRHYLIKHPEAQAQRVSEVSRQPGSQVSREERTRIMAAPISSSGRSAIYRSHSQSYSYAPSRASTSSLPPHPNVTGRDPLYAAIDNHSSSASSGSPASNYNHRFFQPIPPRTFPIPAPVQDTTPFIDQDILIRTQSTPPIAPAPDSFLPFDLFNNFDQLDTTMDEAYLNEAPVELRPVFPTSLSPEDNYGAKQRMDEEEDFYEDENEGFYRRLNDNPIPSPVRSEGTLPIPPRPMMALDVTVDGPAPRDGPEDEQSRFLAYTNALDDDEQSEGGAGDEEDEDSDEEAEQPMGSIDNELEADSTPEDVVVSCHIGLRSLHVPALATLGLQFHPVYRVLICIQDGMALRPKQVLKHVKKHFSATQAEFSLGVGHRTSKTVSVAQMEALQAFCDRYNVSQDGGHIVLPPPNGPAVEGLHIYKGFRCLYEGCTHCTIKSTSMATHRTQKHQTDAAPYGATFEDTHVQTFFKDRRKYFSIDPHRPHHLDETGSDSNVSILLVSISNMEKAPVDPAEFERLRSPLLKITDWDKHLAPTRATAESRARALGHIKIPKQKREPFLFPLIATFHAYTSHIADLASQVPVIVKRFLMGLDHDPSAGPWSQLDDTQSRKRYDLIGVCLIRLVISSLWSEPSEYRLTLSEKEATYAEELYCALQSKSNDLVATVPLLHRLLWAIITEHIVESMSDKFACPIMCFLALLSLNNDGSFKEAYECTQPPAIFKFLLRGIVLYEGVNTGGQSLNDPKLPERIKLLSQSYLTEGAMSPFHSVSELQHFISTIAFNTLVAPQISWNADYSVVSCHSVSLNLSDWRQGTRDMLAEVWRQLTLLTDGERLPVVIPADLHEDLQDRKVGNSWRNHKDVPELYQPLFSAINAKLHLTSKGEDGSLVWNEVACQPIWRIGANIGCLFATIMFMVPAPSARGSQHADILIENTSDGQRHLFKEHGNMLQLTSYGKKSSTTGRDVLLPRYYPSEVQEALDYYLLIFRQLELAMATFTMGPKQAEAYRSSLFVMEGKRMTNSNFGRIFRTYTKKWLKVEVPISYWRHISVALKRAFIEAIPLGDELGAMFNDHSVQTERNRYAISKDGLHHLTSDFLAACLVFCGLWWEIGPFRKAPGHAIPLCKQKAILGPTVQVDGTVSASGTVQLAGLQAVMECSVGLSLALREPALFDEIKKVVYDAMSTHAMTIATQQNLIIKQQKQLMQMMAHFTSNGNNSPVAPLPFPQQTSSPPVTYDQVLPEALVDIQLPLQRMFSNPLATFKSEHQRQMVQASCDHVSTMLVIIGTGGGKSLIWELPASFESNLSIVVVPFIAPMLNFVQRATDLGIQSHIWTTRDQDFRNARIIFVAIESFVNEKFARFMRQQSAYIARIVIDEAHTVMTSKTFRGAFMDICNGFETPVPRYAISATIPVSMVDDLLNDLGMPPTTLIIRAPTDQPHHRYNVLTVTPSSQKQSRLIPVAIALAKTVSNCFFSHADSRGIIFCSSRQQAQDVFELMDVGSAGLYTSGMETEARKKITDMWTRIDGIPWIVATSGLIHGIDYPRVDCIIFCDNPYGLIDFVQGSGRAGRAGQPSLIYMLSEPNRFLSLNPEDPSSKHQLRKEFNTWKKNQLQCRRHHISLFLDGEAMNCKKLKGAQLCDVCDTDSDPCKWALEAISGKSVSLQVDDGEEYKFGSEDYELAIKDLDDMGDLDNILDSTNPNPSPSRAFVPSAGMASRSTKDKPPSKNADPSSSRAFIPSAGMASRSTKDKPLTKLQQSAQNYVDAAAVRQEQEKLTTSKLALEKHMNIISPWCHVCWFSMRKAVRIYHPGHASYHQPYRSCRVGVEDPLGLRWRWIYQWLDVKKYAKSMEVPGNGYICSYCGIPNAAQPQWHHRLDLNKEKCTWSDILFQSTWFVWHSDDMWNAMQAELSCPIDRSAGPLLPKSQKAWGLWISQRYPRRYTNGIEVFLWLCRHIPSDDLKAATTNPRSRTVLPPAGPKK